MRKRREDEGERGGEKKGYSEWGRAGITPPSCTLPHDPGVYFLRQVVFGLSYVFSL